MNQSVSNIKLVDYCTVADYCLAKVALSLGLLPQRSIDRWMDYYSMPLFPSNGNHFDGGVARLDRQTRFGFQLGSKEVEHVRDLSQRGHSGGHDGKGRFGNGRWIKGKFAHDVGNIGSALNVSKSRSQGRIVFGRIFVAVFNVEGIGIQTQKGRVGPRQIRIATFGVKAMGASFIAHLQGPNAGFGLFRKFAQLVGFVQDNGIPGPVTGKTGGTVRFGRRIFVSHKLGTGHTAMAAAIDHAKGFSRNFGLGLTARAFEDWHDDESMVVMTLTMMVMKKRCFALCFVESTTAEKARHSTIR